MYHRDCIPLNKTSLIFLHPDQTPTRNPLIAQVTVRHAGESVVDELAQFYVFHHEITYAIETLICAHISTPLPPTLEIEGEGFVIRATRKSWVYGRNLEIRWGDLRVVPLEDKWTFVVHSTRIWRLK